MRGRAPDLEGAAVRLARLLGEKDCLLVGGMAVGVHGYVRATKDIDFIVKTGLADVSRRLRQHGISTILTRGNPLEGDFPCVKGTLDGVRFDVMPQLVSLDWDRAIEVPMARGAILRVVDLEGLIRLKLRAQGPRDLLDVAALVLLHPDQLQIAREVAAGYRVADNLEVWLNDPRLKAEVLETTRGKKGNAKLSRGRGPRQSGRKKR